MACAILKGEFDAAPLPVEVGGFLYERDASTRQFRRNRHGADTAAGIAGIFFEIRYSGRRPDPLAGAQGGGGVLGPQNGFFWKGEGGFFFTDIQRGRFLHLFRPLIAEGDPIVEDTGPEPEGGVLPGNHVFIEADGRGGVFAPRLEGVANVILHFFHIPSRDASGEVFSIHDDAQPGWFQNRFAAFFQRMGGLAARVEPPGQPPVRRLQGCVRFRRLSGAGQEASCRTAEHNE